MQRASVIGIDPGEQGAIVRLVARPQLCIEYVRIDSLPEHPGAFCRDVVQHFARWRVDGPIVGVGLEEPLAVGGNAHVLKYLRRFGHLEAAVALTGADITLWGPSQWQARILKRIKGHKAKACSRHAFTQIFRMPEGRKLHDGVIDAALIAVTHAIHIGLIEPITINWAGMPPAPIGEPKNDDARKSPRKRPRRRPAAGPAH